MGHIVSDFSQLHVMRTFLLNYFILCNGVFILSYFISAMEIAIKEIICICDCTSDPLILCYTLEVKVIGIRLISLLIPPCRLGSSSPQKVFLELHQASLV